jgi:amino acid permease
MFGREAPALTLLSVPATFATAFGFIFPYGRRILAMAESKLLPQALARRRLANDSPYAAYLAGSLVGYAACLVAWYNPRWFGKYLFNICLLGAFTGYSAQTVNYLLFKTKYCNVERKFLSPVGVTGALFAQTVWVVGAASVIGLQGDSGFAVAVYACTIAALVVYYRLFLTGKQVLSEEESKLLLVLHAINCKCLYVSVRVWRVCLECCDVVCVCLFVHVR